jgi:endo-1,4-beta-D-glucanase Y
MRPIARWLAWGAVALLAALSGPSPARAQQPNGFVIPAEVWASYRQKFIEDSGRVVDTANGGISHSEGQGYGLMLAVIADDRAAFEQIWSFTITELLIRGDGLAAWKWDPNATPRVTDINNATDGDILIAWALAMAGERWHAAAYLDAARHMARAIGTVALRSDGGRTVLLPGASGFAAGDRPDGPILNLSYWVFEALPVLARLAPNFDWAGVERTGLSLVGSARFGTVQLPTDWISVPAGAPPVPAEGFPPVFGYNSLRIPLYLIGAGHAERQRLEPFYRSWTANGGRPAIVDVTNGKVLEVLGEPGYRMQTALLACALDGVAIPDELKRFQPTSYYASTLHLLAMTVVARRYPRCL